MALFNMLIGLPGAGKSVYAHDYAYGKDYCTIISSDDIRKELWGDANDQQNPKVVFDEMYRRTVAALIAGKTVVYDATNLSAKTRKSTLNLLRRAIGDELTAVATLITCSISECKRRQGDRDRKVPNEVIDRMVRQFEAPWYNEGWDSIHVVSRGKKQNIDKEHWRMLGEPHDNPHHTSSLEMHCANCMGNMGDLIAANFDNFLSTDSVASLLKEAAYQHDLGKHKTKVFHNSKGEPTDIAHYYSHNNVGAYLWLSGDKAGDWSDDEFLLIGALIQWHMQPFFLRDDNGEYRTKFRDWCNKRGFNDVFYLFVCLLHEADKAAH